MTTIVPASDHSLLVRFGDRISIQTHRQVRKFMRWFCAPGVRNLHPAYTSVLISFDPLRTTHEELAALAREAAGDVPAPAARLVEIPVRYGGEFGPDLADVARLNGLTPERVVEVHSSSATPDAARLPTNGSSA